MQDAHVLCGAYEFNREARKSERLSIIVVAISEEKMEQNQLKQFDGQKYLTLESYRKNGTAVPTPMSFIVENGVLYLRTNRKSWKMKRISSNSHVRVVPSDPRGNPLGTWVDAQASPFGLGEMEWVYTRFKQKYRFDQKFVDLFVKLKKMQYVVIAVRLESRQQNGVQPA